MDMEPWRHSLTPSISMYSEGGSVGWFSRWLNRDSSEEGASMMVIVTVELGSRITE